MKTTPNINQMNGLKRVHGTTSVRVSERPSCSILAKADAKLLKQQLFNDFWRNMRVGAFLWNTNAFTTLAFSIGTSNILYESFFCILSWLWKFCLYKSGSRVLKLTSIQSKSRSNQYLDLADWPWFRLDWRQF